MDVRREKRRRRKEGRKGRREGGRELCDLPQEPSK